MRDDEDAASKVVDGLLQAAQSVNILHKHSVWRKGVEGMRDSICALRSSSTSSAHRVWRAGGKGAQCVNILHKLEAKGRVQGMRRGVWLVSASRP